MRKGDNDVGEKIRQFPTAEELQKQSKPLTQEKIEELGKGVDHQVEFVLNLYRYAFGNEVWDAMTELDGYPVLGDETWKAVCEVAIRIDKALHPDVMAGGLWMNKGFSCDSDLEEWTIGFARVKSVSYKEG